MSLLKSLGVTRVYTSFFKPRSKKTNKKILHFAFTSSFTPKLWNDLVIKWNDLGWKHLTMERSDHKPTNTVEPLRSDHHNNVKIKWSLSGGGLIRYESQQTRGLFRVLTGPNLFNVWKIINLLHVKCFD